MQKSSDSLKGDLTVDEASASASTSQTVFRGDAASTLHEPLLEELAMLRRDIERLPKSPGKDDALRRMANLERAIARSLRGDSHVA